jgi:hypothetical protein
MPVIDLRGFRISGSIGSASEGAPWTLSASVALVDPSVVDPEDQSFRDSKSKTVPFNEAPSLEDARLQLQALVDEIFDTIPTPAAPPAP